MSDFFLINKSWSGNMTFLIMVWNFYIFENGPNTFQPAFSPARLGTGQLQWSTDLQQSTDWRTDGGVGSTTHHF